jgi:hypothetical protein
MVMSMGGRTVVEVCAQKNYLSNSSVFLKQQGKGLPILHLTNVEIGRQDCMECYTRSHLKNTCLKTVKYRAWLSKFKCVSQDMVILICFQHHI